MTYQVYCHTAPSGKRYVGWTQQGTRARWREHVKNANAGSSLPFHRAIRKYGAAAFTHEVLERMTTEAGAKRAEQLWIARLATFGRGGYNATTGGEGSSGLVHTAETRAKISAAHVGFSGRRHSAETLAKKRGRKHTATALEKMRVAAARRVRRGGRFA